MEFLAENWSIGLGLVGTAILAGIAEWKYSQTKELERDLEHETMQRLRLDETRRKYVKRCADLTLIVDSLEAELLLLKRKSKS